MTALAKHILGLSILRRVRHKAAAACEDGLRRRPRFDCRPWRGSLALSARMMQILRGLSMLRRVRHAAHGLVDQ